MECRHGIYLGCGCSSGPRGRGVDTVFLYYTRRLVRSAGGVHFVDMGAMKAEGQARLEPPRSPSYAYTGYCVLTEGYLESGVVGNYEYADGNGFRGVTGDGRLHGGGGTQTTEGSLLLRGMRAAFFPWLPLCAGQRSPCFLLVAMLLRCCALPPYPRRTNGPASVAVANANAMQLPLPPKAWLTGIPGPLGPPSCCGPPQAALGPTGSSEAGTTCRHEMPGNSSRRHDKWL